MIARLLIAMLVAMTPVTVTAGDEFQDANDTTFDGSVVSLDNAQAGQTTFSIDTNATTIDWQDLQQPSDNTLEFNFSDPNSIVLNDIGAQHPSELNGTVLSNGTVAFANPFGVFIGDTAVIDVGHLVAIGGSVSREDFLTSQEMLLPLTGSIENDGLIFAEGNVALLGRNIVNRGEIHSGGHILAIAGRSLELENWNGVSAEFRGSGNFLDSLTGDSVTNHGSIASQSASLLGHRIVNFGEIEIADGSLMMVAADSVWVTEFDNPVLIKIPNYSAPSEASPDDASPSAGYAIENHGRIDAGLGHVRLAASDPLGFAIRQGAGTAEQPAEIAAQEIDLEGGATGRVHLEGSIVANDTSEEGHGGSIDVTGSMIVLDGATIEASGSAGGGTIHIGGEQQGTGTLQRARVVVVDEDTTVRADALQDGDGGRVIVFAEDLTSVDGELSARGGVDGGDGGFVETSGLLNFLINRRPDVSAASGVAGTWLIDPWNIAIVAAAPDCPADGVSCLNKGIEAILDPDFDSAGFDGILRTVDPADNIPGANTVSADLIAQALATGTNVTLSTQAFGVDTGTEAGNIDVLADILIVDADVLEGTVATLTLLAAGDINVANRIESMADLSGRTNLALSVTLRANDLGQVQSDERFSNALLEGDVLINADILTGGGDVSLSGASVIQQAGTTIDTDGGEIEIRTGTVEPSGLAAILTRRISDPEVDPFTSQPVIQIAGTLDTSDGSNDGGDVTLVASSLSVRTNQSGDDPLDIIPGQLTLESTGQIVSGGGDVRLSGGSLPTFFGQNFAGNAEVFGDIDSAGGDVQIFSIHVDPDGDTGAFEVSFVDPALGEGGVVDVDVSGGSGITTGGGFLAIGSEITQSVQVDGNLDTRADVTQVDTSENGLVQLVAIDTSSVDTDDQAYGQGEVLVGTRAATTIDTAGLTISSRDVTFAESGGANAVVVSATGSSTATPVDFDPNEESEILVSTERVEIDGTRSVTFSPNVEITTDEVLITAGSQPLDMNDLDPILMTEAPRLIFDGANGAGQTAADGVRLNADEISMTTGDGTTNSSTGFAEDLGTGTNPTEFGLQRLSNAIYDGLQLRSMSDPSLRPEDLSIAQDADLTITEGTPTAPGELNLTDAFDGATIGTSGMSVVLESSDGVLTIEDAVSLNNGAGAVAGSDAEKSFVVLNGGLFLPPTATVPTRADDTVVFFDGVQSLGTGGTSAFDVGSLSVSTPGNFTVSQQIVDSIAASEELAFEAGRSTENASSAGRGTLSIDAGLTLQADTRLSLSAGGAGFGDLVFSGPGTTLSTDDLALRAGGGLDSENTDPDARSSIVGLQANVSIQDGSGGVFGDAASSANAFSYRQDAAIDAATDLPDLTQFGLLAATGFRAAGDVAYGVRSDQAQIDLDDETPGTDEGDRFRNSALSLIGVDTGSAPAIDVSDEFSFVGKSIELGGIEDFTFTQELATAFNRTGLDADEVMTLRAGIAIAGELDFDRGGETSVLVKAPTVNLVAGNGFNLTEEAQLESTIDARNASFDLAGPAGSTQTFVFHTDSLLELGDLPDNDQFVGGNAGLPDILALRTDLAQLEFVDFDATLLPLDLTDDPGRLVLEAESVLLSQTDGSDLELTSIPNLELRIRANNLTLTAADSVLADAADARVLIGPRPGDMNPLTGMDSDFDGESLLIEAFDRDATLATSANLSVLSADPLVAGQFDLDQGRGPTAITILQDGPITPDQIFLRDSVSGRLARSAFDEEDGTPIATTYGITSRVDTVTVAPENVNASQLRLNGIADTPDLEGIVFDPGMGPTPGVFDFDSLVATTESSIFIQDGTILSATNQLALTAGFATVDAEDPGTVFGQLGFEAGPGTTIVSGQSILLTAGPPFRLDFPDNDGDGEPDPIPDADLPRVDFTNLDEIRLTGDPEESVLDIKQNANLAMLRGTSGDFLTPVEAGMGIDKWSSLIVDVVQGNLRLEELDALAAVTESLTGRNTGLDDATLTVHVPDASVTTTPFDDFDGLVEFDSNDVTFVTTDPGTSINLATDNLQLVSFSALLSIPADDELGRLRGDDEISDRPIVRIHQAIDFTDTELPRPDQYVVIDGLGDRATRSDLSGIDIELKTTGNTLTLDDDIRERVSFSNLILESGSDVDIMLDGPTPGYLGLEYAALQLNSLDIITPDTSGIPDFIGDGVISIRPFMIAGNPEVLTLETSGDQQFDGVLVLDTTFSTEGRSLIFTNDITQAIAPDAGLRISTSGAVNFQGQIGSVANPLNHLWVGFDTRADDVTPLVEFGRRVDLNLDDIKETPLPSNQTVHVLEDVLFAAYDFFSDLTAAEIEAGLAGITALTGAMSVDSFLSDLELGRDTAIKLATIGKALGDLTFEVANGHFIMASGEKMSVGGTATVNVDPATGLVALGDVAALDLIVDASDIGLVRRASGVNFDREGETQQDAGASILANTIDFGPITPTEIGSGRSFRFGVPNPWDDANLPAFLGDFPLFEIKASGAPLDTGDFRFASTTGALATFVPSLRPKGSSRSDLSGAFGPKIEPIPTRVLHEPLEPTDTSHLLELSIDALPTPNPFRLARLREAGVIDDLDLGWDEDVALITTARLDSTDAREALALYDGLFGPEGERADDIRATLQDALDKYLLNTRARRVIGFELRRFVKNRPSTLLDAYTTLDSLDTLFRYHRRIGLSPGEYRRIQKNWLRSIQPDGITLDELSEAIHPSRYVRGSDILDIFGR